MRPAERVGSAANGFGRLFSVDEFFGDVFFGDAFKPALSGLDFERLKRRRKK